VILGGSRGGEAALLVASAFPGLFHGAIGLVPNSSAWPSLDTYPEAGHLAGGIPYVPPPPDHSPYGGSPAADSASGAGLWPRILALLRPS
jgi:hypothetical protein